MEEKKVLSLEGLAHYDGLIKEKIDNDILSAKSYTDEEVAKKTAIQFYTWEDND